MTYKVGNLLFDNENNYLELCDLNRCIEKIARYTEGSNTPVKELFSNIDTVNVTECCYNAREELDGLFANATRLLCFEGTRFKHDYDVGCCFFDKINVIEYRTDESDSKSVSFSLPMSDSESESESESESLPMSESESESLPMSESESESESEKSK